MKILRFFLLALLVIPAGGCWDYRDVSDRLSVLGMGVDLGPNGEHVATIEITTLGFITTAALPGSAGQTAGGGGGAPRGGGGSQKSKREVITSRGPTSTLAFHTLRRSGARPLSFGHAGVLILGENYARRGVRDEVGCAGCHPEMPTASFIAVTPGSAAGVLTTQAPIQTYTSLYLQGLFENARAAGSIPFTDTIARFVAEMSTGRPAAIPRLISYPGGGFKMAGAGVFEDFAFVGWLSEEETLGMNILRGRGRHSMVTIPCVISGRAEGGEVDAAVEVSDRTSRLRFTGLDERGIPSFYYQVKAEAIDMGSGCLDNAFSEDSEIEAEVARQVRRSIDSAIRRAREMGVDFLGIGEFFERKEPALWERLQWKQVFPLARIEVDIEVNLERSSRFHGRYIHEGR